MKAKVIIEEGKSIIELTPENPFEEQMLESTDSYGIRSEITCAIRTQRVFGVSERKLVVEVVEKPKQATRCSSINS